MKRIIRIKKYVTHKSLCNYLNIPQSTLSTWLSLNNQTLPSLDKLDYFCNKMNISTSDLFVPNSSFGTPHFAPNNSMANIRTSLKYLSIERGLTSIKSRVMFLFQPSDANYFGCEALYYAYTRTERYRCPPIQQLDEFAMRFDIETYKLLQGDQLYEKN